MEAKPVCSSVIPATRLHFFIRIGLQLGLLRTAAVAASHNVRCRSWNAGRVRHKTATHPKHSSARICPVRLQAGGASLCLYRNVHAAATGQEVCRGNTRCDEGVQPLFSDADFVSAVRRDVLSWNECTAALSLLAGRDWGESVRPGSCLEDLLFLDI